MDFNFESGEEHKKEELHKEQQQQHQQEENQQEEQQEADDGTAASGGFGFHQFNYQPSNDWGFQSFAQAPSTGVSEDSTTPSFDMFAAPTQTVIRAAEEEEEGEGEVVGEVEESFGQDFQQVDDDQVEDREERGEEIEYAFDFDASNIGMFNEQIPVEPHQEQQPEQVDQIFLGESNVAPAEESWENVQMEEIVEAEREAERVAASMEVEEEQPVVEEPVVEPVVEEAVIEEAEEEVISMEEEEAVVEAPAVVEEPVVEQAQEAVQEEALEPVQESVQEEVVEPVQEQEEIKEKVKEVKKEEKKPKVTKAKVEKKVETPVKKKRTVEEAGLAAESSTEGTPRSSSRMRKSVDRLSMSTVEVHHRPGIEVASGTGSKLGDIPHIAKELQKKPAGHDLIIVLHRILFGRPGDSQHRKAHLRAYNGLAEEGREAALKAMKDKLGKHTVVELRDFCVLLNLERTGDREGFINRIAEFLADPKDLGESKPAPKRTPKSKSVAAAKGKRGRPAAKAAQAKKAKNAASKSQSQEALSKEILSSDLDTDEEEAVIADLQQEEVEVDAMEE